MDANDDKKKDCPCYSKSCPRHGNCQACQEYHRRDGSRTSCGK